MRNPQALDGCPRARLRDQCGARTQAVRKEKSNRIHLVNVISRVAGTPAVSVEAGNFIRKSIGRGVVLPGDFYL